MLVGLALVGLAALAERTAFTSLPDIHSDFRITATFSSMHVGGGHIGAYLAFAMPFVIDLPAAAAAVDPGEPGRCCWRCPAIRWR